MGTILSKKIKTKKNINPKPVEVELKNKMELVRFTKSNIKLKIINP